MELQYQRLCDAIKAIVNAPGMWPEKRAAFAQWAVQNADDTLSEFLGWFEGNEAEDYA